MGKVEKLCKERKQGRVKNTSTYAFEYTSKLKLKQIKSIA